MNGTVATLRNVLLVDDDKVTNLLHARLIKRSGLIDDIEIATDGLAALECLEARRDQQTPMPELILLDINMPRMDGFEFLVEYAQRSADFNAEETMIVMVSTSVLRADQDRAEADENVKGFISKPIGVEEIEGLVEQYQRRVA